MTHPSDSSRLSRLPREYYFGEAWVHWIMNIEDRKVGWLDSRFYYKFREVLAHVTFRYQVASPIFCLMPDHIHLLLCGLVPGSDQLLAIRQLRRDTNECLRRINFQLQKQAYDHVLRDEEIERTAIEETMEYIARNPERKNLVNSDGWQDYPYTSCMLPGYPQVRLWEDSGWDRIWRILAYLKRTQVFRVADPNYEK